MTETAYQVKLARFAPVLEWMVWVAIASTAIAMTGHFNQDMAQYNFGADGWPLAICIGIILGATGQLASRYIIQRGHRAELDSISQDEGTTTLAIVKRLAIFLLPFVYLFLTTRIGAYVATPLFILGLLYLLEVKSPITALAVTSVITGLLLLLFTRFFFVALPVGRIPFFYDLNVAIIGLARAGM